MSLWKTQKSTIDSVLQMTTKEIKTIINKEYEINKINETQKIIENVFRSLQICNIALKDFKMQIASTKDEDKNNNNENNNELEKNKNELENKIIKLIDLGNFCFDLLSEILNNQIKRIKKKWTRKIIELLSEYLSIAPINFIARCAYNIVESLNKRNISGKTFDLLPSLLVILKHQPFINLDLISYIYIYI